MNYVEEMKRRTQRGRFSAESLCFAPQLAFIRDPARFKVAVCSRRAGKTVASAVALLEGAIAHPGTNHLYVTLSRVNAKRIVWRQLLDLNRDHALGGVPNETELSLTMPNGSLIYLSGAKDNSEIEKFRGLSLKGVIIDESQSFRPYIKRLIDDVLAPAMWDRNGSLSLIGTPGPIMSGTFYEACTGKNWSAHRWTILDNPHIKRLSGKEPSEILAEERARRGITEEDPTYQRESLGQWVNDTNALVFQYDASRNGLEGDDPRPERYVLGVDLGFDDADAIAVIGWGRASPNCYLVAEHVAAKSTITELGDRLKALVEQYRPERLVIDAGGLGKKIGEELRTRWQLPIEAADKARKLEHIALLNDSLRMGKFKAAADSRFAQDALLVQWEPDARGVKISDSYHSDILDAALYAFRACQHYLYEAPAPALTPEQKIDLWEQREIAAMERDKSVPWWKKDGARMGYG